MLVTPYVIVGLLLLTLGRRLFWLFAAGVGFWIGFSMIGHLWPAHGDEVVLGAALIAGVIGALLGVFLQGVAVVVCGFIAGGQVTAHLLALTSLGSGGTYWILVVLGGMIGTVFLLIYFDWALVIISCMVGAILISGVFQPGHPPGLWIAVLLFGVGVWLQSAGMRRRR